MTNKRSVVTTPVLEDMLDNLIDVRQKLTERLRSEKMSTASLIKLCRAVTYVSDGIIRLAGVRVDDNGLQQDELDRVLEGIQLGLPFQLSEDEE